MSNLDFYQELEEYAKAYPAIQVGMTVAIYQHSYERPFVGYGRIIAQKWSNFYAQYSNEVMLYQSCNVVRDVLACDLDPVCWTKSIARTLIHGVNK